MSDSPASISQDAVLEKLKNVIDPELFVNIVDLGLIYEIVVDGDKPAAEDAEAEAAPSPGNTEPEVQTAEEPASNGAAVEGSYIKIDMTMTSPACPAGPQLIAGAKKEVGSIEGVGEVEVKIVLDPPWTPDRMTEDAKDQLGIF
ncbi:MAG: metal-sulfur cluster assembly factor [Planctomycetota bacterium]|nr:metal-sulfur cluster assembly factor [Planctomycetota bacterium]MEC8338298.1 metal-sulfur cluster assembly factor [Planctomycetota bacterium]